MWYDSRQMKRCTSDEIADTLRGELESGRYRAGKALPSVAELRNRFGAGEFAVRAALHKLRDEGLVAVKSHVGTVATAKGRSAWKGHLLFVHTSSNASYFVQRLAIQLSQRFESAGWCLHPVFIDADRDGCLDVGRIVRHVANGVSFAIVLSEFRQVSAIFDRAAVPYVILNGFAKDFPHARAVIRDDYRKCFLELIDALKKRNAVRVLEFDMERRMDRGFKSLMFDNGIKVSRVMCRFDNESQNSLAYVKLCGYNAVRDYFADERHRNSLPDVIIFDDDYLAAGGITALLEAGVKIPEDVGIVTYSNKGNEVVIGKSPARIEHDPVATGDAVAKFVLNILSGRSTKPPRIGWRFIPGESL